MSRLVVLATLAALGCANATGVRPCTHLARALDLDAVLVTEPAETLARAPALAREWREHDERIALLEGTLRHPGLLRWPFPADADARGEGLAQLVAAAAAEAGVDVHVERVDCIEYPCVAFGELAAREDLDALIATEAMAAARRRATLSVAFAPPEDFRRNVWRETERAGFGLAFYDEGPVSEIIEWRLRARAEEFWEEEEGAVAPVVDADAGDAADAAEELLGARATQKVLEMALVESQDPVWPFPELERYQPDVVVSVLGRAIAQTGVSAVLYYADCSEYPCMLYGEVAEEWQLERILAASELEPYLSTGNRWLLLRPVDGVVRRVGEDCRLHAFTLALYLTRDRPLMVRRMAWRVHRYWHARGGVGDDARVWSD